MTSRYNCLSVVKRFKGGLMGAQICGDFREDAYNPHSYFTDSGELWLEVGDKTFYRRIECRWEPKISAIDGGYWSDAWASDTEWEDENGERMSEAEYKSVVEAIGSECRWYLMELNLLRALAHKAVAYVIVLDMENYGELLKDDYEDDDE